MGDSNPPGDSAATKTTATSEPPAERKIDIFFKNTGNAPVIRDTKTKWKVKPSTKISEISNLLQKILNLDASQSIFIYVNQSFAPSLDQTIQNLYDCYECDKSEMKVAGEESRPDLKDIVVVLDKWTRTCDMILSSLDEQITKISKTNLKAQ